ncbi:Flp family type IVb pilin [Streptomyces scabiei]|uniref:Flp family type IVb pilin n=1 Tax=Streptomyces scabiei TaxID=1930 RepID=UPI0038F727B5
MENAMRKLLSMLKQENGATAIEYGLIAALIAVAIVGVLVTLGPALSNTFSTVQSSL